MRRRPTILFSTTSQWNVGDEFILRGVLRAFEDSGVVCNPVIFNRNPAVSTPWKPFIAYPPRPTFPWENSSQLLPEEPIDYVIFAGTPEWEGGVRAERLHEFIIKKKLRCAFLGVGLSNARSLSGRIAQVLREHTDVFVARDQHAYQAAQPHLPTASLHRQSCPAILCCRDSRPPVPSAPSRIGFNFQDSRTLWQSVPVETRDYLLEQYRELSAHFALIGLAHYVDDLYLATAHGIDCRYSYDSRDYESLYRDLDLVITTRVHGAGIAASLGVPSVLIAHDGRAPTAEGFGAHVVTSGTSLLPIIKGADWAARAATCIDLKTRALEFYSGLIRSLAIESRVS